MRRIRGSRRHKIAAAVAVAAGVLMIVVATLASSSGENPNGSDTTDGARTRQVDPVANPAPPDPSKASDGSKDSAKSLKAKAKALGKGLGSSGLKGQGGVKGLPKHQITVKLTSSSPISGVGYVIPTSVKDYYGKKANLGTSWSLSTVVYGKPDYAQLFAQTDARGHSLTCTITVDGKVTERRTADGPYTQLFCQG